ncbi:GNAT family N-acetyltransferase [Sporosalibacterium faouarense]|uniref:GNAT family N-acetyltransferase n=1 Tax=Sporosalibacterium faouarense TaxID=516123 RepID=UPI00192C5B93|nr:GNAT family N-acetyltransferase [Sporosalibacterium faouarense]
MLYKRNYRRFILGEIKLSELILVNPSKELKEKILKYKQEYLDFEETNINGSCGLARYNDFDEWLDIVLSIKKDKLRKNVHASTFFSVRKSDNRIIGSIQLRHSLTNELEKHGGQIGYGIRPTERKKGYGKQQLLLVLETAKDMKIPKVMIICDKDNVASSKTAMSCGGILIGENLHEGKEQQIYWINLY